MIVIFLLIVVVLIGLTASAVMGKIGGFMAEPTSSQSFPGVSGVLGDPVGSPSAADVGQLRFDQALRGYRMDQVDEVVDALIARVRALEAGHASARADGASQGFSPDVPPVDRSDTQEQ